MNRLKKVIRNLIVLAVLLLILINRSGLYINPISAHNSSERSIHYGPSEVVHIEDFKDSKFFLCKYDNWVSCNTVKRSFLFFWRFGDLPIGIEIDKTKPLNYTWGNTDSYWKVYGIVNDARINRVEITLGDGSSLSQSKFYDNLFLFTLEASDNGSQGYKIIKGYDADNNVIYEKEY